MARGNQRDLARAKNMKKQQEASKDKKGDPAKRMETDAERMRRKQQESDARKAEEAAKGKKA